MRHPAPLLFLLPLAALTSCAPSLDPEPDRARAASLVADRSALSPDWRNLSSCPDWDGHSDLTADQAALFAVSNHREMHAALASIAVSRADLAQSGLLPNPVLNLSLGFPLPGSSGDVAVGASITQQLVALLSRSDRMSAADADLTAQVLRTADLALKINADARAAHARVLHAQRQLEQQRQAVLVAERAVEGARRRFAAGEDTTLHVNRQSLLALRLSADLMRRQADLDARKRELAHAVCRADAAMDFAAVESTVPPSALAALQSLTEEQAIDIALRQRLDVQAADAAATAALARAGIQKTERFGEIEAAADYQHTDDGRDELGPAVALPIPIFDTGAARIARAKADAQRALLEAQDLREEAVLQVRLAYIRAKSALELAQRYEQSITALARQNLDLTQRAFDAGEADLTILIEAEEAIAESGSTLIELQEQAALALIELERVAGGLLAPPPQVAE